MPDEMIYRVFDFADEAAWLKGRLRGIGGSDASAIVGANPYKTNIELFEEKTGRSIPPDISDKPYVQYGHQAEPLIRGLFALDYPQYQVAYHEWRVLQNLTYPFLQASLDGELIDANGRKGILEIKTTNILQSMQREKWNEQIPQNYYIQVLHYLLVTGYEFVVLRAHLISAWGNDVRTQVKHYFIEREEVQEDLDFLLQEEIKFWKYVESGRKPPLILPEI
jgi:putative phage-type endonuclease